MWLANQTATMRLTFILLLVITENLGHAAPAALSTEEVSNLIKGASINDVHKMAGIFDPLTHFSIFGTLTMSAFPWPSPPSEADIMSGGP